MVLFLIFLERWVGEVCWDFVGSKASFLTSVLVSEHISQNVQKRFEKKKSRISFSLKLNLKKKRTFLSSTCIARPLIYVGVSLHSNKKQ